MKREQELVKNTLILSLGTILPKLTTLITLPILTGYLTKAEYGIYDLINTLVSLVIPLVTMKLEMATFRFLIDHRKDKEKASAIITSAFSAVVPVSLIAILIIYCSLRYFQYTPVISFLVSAYFLIENIYTMLLQTARGLGHNLHYTISAIINAVVNMLLIVILVWKVQAWLIGLLIALNAALILSGLFLLISLKLSSYFRLSLLSKKQIMEMLSYSWPLVPNSLSSWVMNLSDRLIVTGILGIEANAVYAVANKIPSLFTTFQGAFISAWHENASIIVGDKDTDDYYSSMFDAVFTIMIGIMAVLIAVTPILFKLLIHEKYRDAYDQMPLLFGGMICFALSSFMGGIYTAHKKTKSVGITTIAAAISNLVINFALVRVIGLYAASLSTFLSYLFLIIFRMIDVRKFQPMRYNLKKIAVFSAVICGMCILTLFHSVYTQIFNFVFGIAFAYMINRKFIRMTLQSVRKKIRK